MVLLVLTIIVQIGLIIHCVYTQRPTYWVFVLLIAPGIGGLAYFIVEILPELSGSMGARRAMRNVKKSINPGADLRQKQLEHRMSGSVDAARHLAGELVEAGRFEEAIEHYERALTGLYERDPDLMLGLATAQFGDEQFEATRDTLDALMEHNPDFRSSDGHLLYARAVEACGDDEKAIDEYTAVAAYYAGAEARARYGQLLERLGRNDEAVEQYREILASAELGPRHYRKAQKEWIRLAKDGVSRLSE